MKLSEIIDFYGIPLCESEIEVKFTHEGRPAVAVFEVSGGHIDRSHGRDLPPEHDDPMVELIGVFYEDDDSDIYAKNVLGLNELEDEAVEKYWDQEQQW